MTAERIKAIKWAAAAIGLLAVGAVAGYWWAGRVMPSEHAMSGSAEAANHSGHQSEHQGGRAAQGADGDRRVLYWHDPMVPGQRFDKPGKSPFMDMQLVPVYADDEAEGGDVRISPSVAQNLGIRLGRVERAQVSSELRAVGNVVFDERLLDVVQARVEGYVTRLYVKAPLEHVRRGQPLAEILAPEWLEAQQEYRTLLEANAESAYGLRKAARERLVVLGVPEKIIHDVETTGETRATTTVFAPADGVVSELGVRQGAAFMPGASLFRINGLSTVWVNAQIPEGRISEVPSGSKVVARATGWPGLSFEGNVLALLPDVDPQTRTLTARVGLDNAQEKLSPGMFVTLDFTGPPSEPQLVVPTEAIIATGERNVVITAREDGGYDVAEVTLGAERQGRSVVLAGLEEGQSIVLSGQFLIDSEASLKSTVDRLASAAQ